MTPFRTEQEEFWAGEFGKEYSNRNAGEDIVAANVHLFSKMLQYASGIGSVVELGANIGLNLRALRTLLPAARLAGVEINSYAVKELQKWDGEKVEVYCGSLFDYKPRTPYDLAFCKGVLIHLKPDMLPSAYDVLYSASRRYIYIAEYYNPSPVAIEYRGHKNRLFKRDFCGELLDRFKDLVLVGYGFAYHRDRNFPQDDITWFLLERRA
jgi:pseudaminic acid biosynthesis-associated methylase